MRGVITSGAVRVRHRRSMLIPSLSTPGAFKLMKGWPRLITNQTSAGARRRWSPRIRITHVQSQREPMAQARIEAFLGGSAAVLGLVGQTGSGKLRAVELAAKAAGFQATVLDRTQGSINYNRMGACTLGQDGLVRTVYVVCGTDCETALPNPKTLPGAKIVLIGNNCCPELRKAGIHVERLNRPTREAMCKTLFLDHDWPVSKAQRLSALADGDWRRLWNLDRLFAGAGVDVAEGSEDDFQQLVLSTTTDKNLLDESPPSAAVHQLFSGHAKSSDTVSAYAEHSVLIWAEANTDIVCASLERMAEIHEAAAVADVLTTGGEQEIGFETFAMTAALEANPSMRYDYTKYRNPWVVSKQTPEAKAIRESWERRGSGQTRLKRRLTQAQEIDTPDADRSETKAAKAKRAPKKAARATTAKAARA